MCRESNRIDKLRADSERQRAAQQRIVDDALEPKPMIDEDRVLLAEFVSLYLAWIVEHPIIFMVFLAAGLCMPRWRGT
jgi:hypothetical protein